MARLFEHPLSIVVVLLVVALLFGSKRLPDAARGLGRSLRIFKSEMDELKNDGKNSQASSATNSTSTTDAPSAISEHRAPGATDTTQNTVR